MKRSNIQFEIIGNFISVDFGFDWYKLKDHNPDLIFIKKDRIVIKNQDGFFKYPFKINWNANHFTMTEINGVPGLLLNAAYLGIFCGSKQFKVNQQISVFDSSVNDNERVIATCYATYYGKQLAMDYEYFSHDMGELAKYLGKRILGCEVDYDRMNETFYVQLEVNYLENGRHYTEKISADLINSDELNNFILNSKEIYRELIQHTATNCITINKKPFGFNPREK